jgi:hypothetical protein
MDVAEIKNWIDRKLESLNKDYTSKINILEELKKAINEGEEAEEKKAEEYRRFIKGGGFPYRDREALEQLISQRK